MRRLPIRLRLTVVFTALMAVVLGGVGIGSVIHFALALDEALDQSMDARARELAANPPRSGLLPSDRDTLEQVISPAGQVRAGSVGAETRPVLDPAALFTARSQPLRVDRDHLDGLPGRARVLAMVSTGRADIVVVGVSLAGRDNALGDLRSELLLALPLVLLAAAGGAYLLTGGALRPVERMRARAAAITADTPIERLPVPPSRDEIARLGATLNDMLDRLQTALAHERDFIADASHELRTPLSLLKTELELALSRPRTTTETGTALRSALEETNRLVSLAEDLLLLARTDRAHTVTIHATPLGPLLHTVAQRYHGVSAARPQPGALRRPPRIVGGGSFGAALAQHLFSLDTFHLHRILVLEAGPFVLPEHVQNLPTLGLVAPGPTTVDPGVPRAEVWGLPWRTNVDQGFPGLAYCAGGRSLFWGGWSPQNLEEETPAELWPAAVLADLRGSGGFRGYFAEAAEQIGVTETNDFVFGAMHQALRKQLFDGLKAGIVSDAIPLADLPLAPLVRDPNVPENEQKLEAPLAVQGRPPRPGFFPLNKFSGMPLLIRAAREAQAESGNDDHRKRLMIVPNCHVTNLETTVDQGVGQVRVVHTSLGSIPVPERGVVVVAASTNGAIPVDITARPPPAVRDAHP